VQDLLLIHSIIGDLEIGGENFGSFVSSDYHCVQFVQSNFIGFQDGIVCRESL
jgi:hypothetical protein